MTLTERYQKERAELIANKKRYDKEYEEFRKADAEYVEAIENFHVNRMAEHIDRIQNMWDMLCQENNETEEIKINFEYEDYRDGNYALTISFKNDFDARVPWRYRAKINYEDKMVCGGMITGIACGYDNFDIREDNLSLWKACVKFTEYLNCFSWDVILRYPKEEYAKDVANIERPVKSDFIKKSVSTLFGKYNYQRTMNKLTFDYVLDYSIENKVPVKLNSWEYVLATKNTPKSFKYNEVSRDRTGEGYMIRHNEKMKRKEKYISGVYSLDENILDKNDMPTILERKKVD